ncbi:hypothetical protein A1Q_0697 [Vibrio campbellii HY01]|nr:hypothetical protein A1Q_0697 [Vibrio campbellii HY01]
MLRSHIEWDSGKSFSVNRNITLSSIHSAKYSLTIFGQNLNHFVREV